MMRFLYVARQAVRSLFARRVFDQQLDADLQFHIEQATAEYIQEGLSPEDARRAALKAFGNPSDVMEDVREVSMWIWWERLAQDLRYGLRGFRRAPALTATAVMSLALGIGATTAIFSIFNTLMLRPLPVSHPATLFQVLHRGDSGVAESSTYAFYQHLKTHGNTIAGTFQVDPTSTMRVLVDGQAEAIVGQRVTGDYFDVLGIRPVIGRVIEARDEEGSTPDRVAVLGHSYWVRRFGSDPGVIGRTVTIDEVPHTIIGVTPPAFFGLQVGRRIDLSIPLDGRDEPGFWKSRALVVRLAPGVSRATATADLDVGFQQYLAGDKTLSNEARARGFKALELTPASSGLSEFRDRYGKPVRAMLAVVSLLLVMGCANLASLFLARAAARQRDLSVCLAFGASRTRLARQVLAEILFITTAGGALGVLVASWGVDALVGFLPDFGAPTHLQVGPDRIVLLFGLSATLLTGLCIGLAPALLAGKIDIRHMLSTGGRTLAFGAGAFKTFIVVQVALSTVLVVAATLFTVTLGNLRAQPLGFVADGVLTLTVDADGTELEGDRLSAIHRQVLEKLQVLPGVQHASFATIPPLSGNEDGKPISIPGVAFSSPGDGVLQVNTVGPDFFETFGVRILQGRAIAASDHQSAPQVAVVSESMARHYFAGLDPVGRRMDVGRARTGGQIEIVGIAADVRYRDLRTPAPRIVYVSAFQREAEEETVFAIRTAGDPALLAASAKREIQTIAPAMLTTNVKTAAGQRDERLVNERLLALLSGGFAVLAVLLAGIGVYGVVTYAVTQRTGELGLRIALGAERAGLIWLVTRGMLTLVTAATLLGVTAAFLTSSLLASLVFGIQPAEPWVYAGTVALLIGIGLLSAIVPTIRAIRIDPVETLRWQ
jgi:predicted permease